MNLRLQTTSIFIKTPSLEKLPTKAKDPILTLRHGYPTLDANRVFHYHGVVIVIIIIIIVAIIIIIIYFIIIIII